MANEERLILLTYLIPDITVLNTKENIEAGEDKILEGAFDYLFETYGIE